MAEPLIAHRDSCEIHTALPARWPQKSDQAFIRKWNRERPVLADTTTFIEIKFPTQLPQSAGLPPSLGTFWIQAVIRSKKRKVFELC
jgi:hypothetical protein